MGRTGVEQFVFLSNVVSAGAGTELDVARGIDAFTDLSEI